MGDRRFPHLGRVVTLDDNNTPHLTITLPPVVNEEVEAATGLLPTEINRKYMEALAERIAVAYDAKATISIDKTNGSVGVTVPLDYDLSENREALLYEEKSLMEVSSESDIAEEVRMETVKRELSDAFTFAKYDLVNAIPAQDLQNTAQTALDVLMSKKEQTQKSAIETAEDLPDLLKKLSDSPEVVNEIVSGILPEGVKIPEGGVKFSLAGTGRSGIFLKTDIPEHGEVVVGLRTGRTAKAMSATQLQALKQFKAGDFWIEISPALDTKKTTPDHLEELKSGTRAYTSPEGQKYYINDPKVRNIGLTESGRPYYLDGDGISHEGTADPEAYQGSVQTQWVREDGTWEQYHDFQAMHQAYDSPLHQQGGKRSPTKAEVNVNENPALSTATLTTVAAPIRDYQEAYQQLSFANLVLRSADAISCLDAKTIRSSFFIDGEQLRLRDQKNLRDRAANKVAPDDMVFWIDYSGMTREVRNADSQGIAIQLRSFYSFSHNQETHTE
ncbi:MAG: hypothetical protein P8P30_10045 [Rickettsiales bacterium]|nr:hypothetical protein [Rickettsiales bacterium]